MQLIQNLTERQKRFIQLFASIYNIRDAKGQLKPFYPEPFQQEILRDSILCNKSPQNRIINKGRGIGLTALIAGEILLAATLMPKIKIPVASISAKTANVLIDWCSDLADNSNDLGFGKIERDKSIDSMIKLENGSRIIPISGGSPESVRSLRTPILVLDEFAFNQYQKEILTAGERCLSESGQITIISTPRTTDTINDEFWRIWMRAEELKYKKYGIPIFDPKKFNINKSIKEQGLMPIALWLDLDKLEEARIRDPLMFSRENLCSPMDESVAFLPWELIKKCCILREQPLIPDNPIFAGTDVGRTQDLSVVEIFQKVNDVWYHIEEKTMRGIDIPRQVLEIIELDKKYNFININIDSTGIGLGLFEFVKKSLGYKTKGITFSKDVKIGLATNLRTLMQDGKIFLQNHDALMDDIHSVPYNTLDAPRSDAGHSDRFWAICLAIKKEEGRIVNAGEIFDKMF